MPALTLLLLALLIALPLFAAPGLLVAAFRIAADRAEAASLRATLSAPAEGRFDPASIAHLPEPARRYLTRAKDPVPHPVWPVKKTEAPDMTPGGPQG